MSDFELRGHSFDELVELAKTNPEKFEALRQAEIQSVLMAAPESIRTRLEGLQWRIDLERERAHSPLDACSRLSEMMWDRVLGPGGLRENLHALQTGTVPEKVRAPVLPFNRRELDEPGAS